MRDTSSDASYVAKLSPFLTFSQAQRLLSPSSGTSMPQSAFKPSTNLPGTHHLLHMSNFSCHPASQMAPVSPLLATQDFKLQDLGPGPSDALLIPLSCPPSGPRRRPHSSLSLQNFQSGFNRGAWPKTVADTPTRSFSTYVGGRGIPWLL